MTAAALAAPPLPRLGFIGTGWIGRNRLEAIATAQSGIVAAVVEPSSEAAAPVRETFPEAAWCESAAELFARDLDGVVIATPSALHADQSIEALRRGLAVFCQKPLGRDADETRRVVDAAREADRLLGVDLSYRYVEAFARAAALVRSGQLGEIFAVDLTFHNAYGPDKPWFYDPRLAGGGCLIDLGIHLVDFALWTLGFPAVNDVRGAVFAEGKRVEGRGTVAEDYAEGTIDLEGGGRIRLACSWRLHAGRDAAIEATFHGTGGGVTVRNVGGSFYDFTTDHLEGTSARRLAEPPDSWSGRAAVDWARRLARGSAFDPSIEHLVTVAGVLDRMYGAEEGATR